MTASLAVSTCNTDSRALAADHAEVEIACGFVGLNSLNTGAELGSLSGVMLVLPVLELNILQVVCPD